MPTITALQVQKNNQERVSVYLDEAFAFGVSMTAATGLYQGQLLTDEEAAALEAEGAFDLAYNRAVRYLARRPRSESELRTYLQGKGYEDGTIDSVLARLRERGYVDDSEFARFWVENRNRFRPRGGRALRHELRQKGVEQETIEDTLAEQDEETAAYTAIEPKLPRWAELERQDFEQKVLGFLARRGFGFGVSRSVARTAWEEIEAAALEEDGDMEAEVVDGGPVDDDDG